MMDLLTDELKEKGVKITEELILAVLLWVDDVISFAEGEEDQREILQKINEFVGLSLWAVGKIATAIQIDSDSPEMKILTGYTKRMENKNL